MLKIHKNNIKFLFITVFMIVISMSNYGFVTNVYADTATDNFTLKINNDSYSASITRYRGTDSTITIPSTINGWTITSIDGGYFADDPLNHRGAFEGNTNIVSITLPPKLKYIFSSAFSGCTGLTSITIPSDVESINADAFSGCTALTSINVDAANPNFSSVDGVLLDKSGNIFIYPQGKKETSYTVPSSVTTINKDTFGNIYINNKWLESITIPSSVTTINDNAFSGCTALTSINVDVANPNFSSVDGVLFDKTGTKLLLYPIGKTETSYTIPSGVTINEAVLNNKWLKSITIPSSLTDSTGFPSNITDITFQGTSIPFLERYRQSSNATYYLGGIVNNPPYSVTIHLDSGVSDRDKSFFEGAGFKVTMGDNTISGTTGGYYWIKSGSDVVIDSFSRSYSLLPNIDETYYSTRVPSSVDGSPVTRIGDKVFWNEVYLAEIEIPNTITSIGDEAFDNCISIHELTLPNSIISIGNRAFRNCKSISRLTIPYSVTSIGNEAFMDGKGLMNVTIVNPNTSIGKNAFSGAPNLTLIGYKGSTTEKYAASNKIPFKELSGTAPVDVATGSNTVKAVPTASKVMVNAKLTSFDAYNINGNNYFKLRDLAKVVNNTEKNFEVTWDGAKNAINLISDSLYTTVGGELAKGDGTTKTAKPTTSTIYKDGKVIELTVYKIGENNYFKLRDIAKEFNIGVAWDSETKTVVIDTSIDYIPE